MCSALDTIDEFTADIEASVKLDLALELAVVKLVLEHAWHDESGGVKWVVTTGEVESGWFT